jgi:hypothetical protein
LNEFELFSAEGNTISFMDDQSDEKKSGESGGRWG